MKKQCLASLLLLSAIELLSGQVERKWYAFEYQPQTSNSYAMGSRENLLSVNASVWLGLLGQSRAHAHRSPERWGSDEWNDYLHKKFSDKDNYAADVITYYQGYLYRSFCSRVIELFCDEQLFEELRDFIHPNNWLPYKQTGIRQFYATLSRSEQELFYEHVNLILSARERRAQEQRKEEERRSQEQREAQEWAAYQARVEREQRLHEALRTRIGQNTLEKGYTPDYAILPETIANGRRHGADLVKQKKSTITTHKYDLSPQVKNVLQSYKLPSEKYHSCTGIELQHALHRECITIVEKVGLSTHDVLNATIIDFVEAGREHNQAGMLDGALKVLDVCWVGAGRMQHADSIFSGKWCCRWCPRMCPYNC